jgi:hypothetical protein
MSEVIQFNQLIAFLENASLFEIYRISVAIDNELANPVRIRDARDKFKVGDTLEYFNKATNSFIAGVVLSKSIKNVAIQNCTDGAYWKIPYYLLKLDSRDFNFSSPKQALNKNSLRVGDVVGFNSDGVDVIGRISRLNQKTVSLVTANNRKWRVSYSLLYPVIDGQTGVHNLRFVSDLNEK